MTSTEMRAPHSAVKPSSATDTDPLETLEWLDALSGVLHATGPDRALYLLQRLATHTHQFGRSAYTHPYQLYRNTIPRWVTVIRAPGICVRPM
jgi:pyruvate dehydrogenase complex dehydrogenase (E1) component